MTTRGRDTVAPSLYDDLGGSAALAVVVEDLYRRLLRDPDLAPIFLGVDTDHLASHVHSFLAAAFGAEGVAYLGRELDVAHHGLFITHGHVDLMIGHLSAALAEASVEPRLAGRVVDRLAGLRSLVVDRRTELD